MARGAGERAARGRGRKGGARHRWARGASEGAARWASGDGGEQLASIFKFLPKSNGMHEQAICRSVLSAFYQTRLFYDLPTTWCFFGARRTMASPLVQNVGFRHANRHVLAKIHILILRHLARLPPS